MKSGGRFGVVPIAVAMAAYLPGFLAARLHACLSALLPRCLGGRAFIIPCVCLGPWVMWVPGRYVTVEPCIMCASALSTLGKFFTVFAVYSSPTMLCTSIRRG